MTAKDFQKETNFRFDKFGDEIAFAEAYASHRTAQMREALENFSESVDYIQGNLHANNWADAQKMLRGEVARCNDFLEAAALSGSGEHAQDDDGWVKISDRIPELNEPVLVFDGSIDIAYRRKNPGLDGYWWQLDSISISQLDVTHWRPLPSAPRKEGE